MIKMKVKVKSKAFKRSCCLNVQGCNPNYTFLRVSTIELSRTYF